MSCPRAGGGGDGEGQFSDSLPAGICLCACVRKFVTCPLALPALLEFDSPGANGSEGSGDLSRI